MLNVSDLDLTNSSSPKSPLARNRRSVANSVCLTPNSANLLSDSHPRNLAAECNEWEKKIDAIKLQIDSQMFQLRTQIGRIEELERLVDAASAQLTSARRRRDSDILSVETQQKQLASAIERQELENQRIEAAFTATQSKNAVLDKEIRKQVISLADSFAPHWTTREYATAINPMDRSTQSPPTILQNSFPSAASASSSTMPSPNEKHLAIASNAKAAVANSSFGASTSPTPEGSAPPNVVPFSLADLIDARQIDERIHDIVRWKERKDAEERERQAQQEKLRLEEAARQEDDEAYARLQKKLEQWHLDNAHRQRNNVNADLPSLPAVPALLSPTKPPDPDPMKVLKQRYSRSANASVRKNAVESLAQAV